MAINRSYTEGILIYATMTDVPLDLHTLHISQANKGIFSRRGKTGYHYYITTDGTAHRGRELDEVGQHTLGAANFVTLGICLEGGRDEHGNDAATFTPNQFDTLELLVRGMRSKYGHVYLLGANATQPTPSPCFDWAGWAKGITDGDTAIVS